MPSCLPMHRLGTVGRMLSKSSLDARALHARVRASRAPSSDTSTACSPIWCVPGLGEVWRM
jgi:hypothetical protein